MALVEQYESREITETRRSATGTRIFVCGWSERKTVAPEFDSEWPDDSNLKLVERHFMPFGKNGSGTPGSEYEYCKITCKYSNTALESDGEVLETADFSVDVMSLNPNEVTWGSDATNVDQYVNKLFPQREVSIQKTVITENAGAIMYATGKLNAYQWRGYYPETVLFMGASTSKEYDAVYGQRIRLNYKFLVRGQSHNLIWRSNGTWDWTNPRLYDSVDFAGLLGI